MRLTTTLKIALSTSVLTVLLTGCLGTDFKAKDSGIDSNGSFGTPATPTPQPTATPAPTPIPTPTPTPAPTPTPSGSIQLPAGAAHMTFHDDFDSGLPSRSTWNLSYNHNGAINNELQYYAPDAFVAGNGFTRIRADQRQMYGFNYTSGAMTTLGGFNQTYGYFEMRAKVPKGNGLWPAFWLLPQSFAWPPEIDVMELLGQDPTTLYMTYHWLDSANQHQGDGSPFTGPDFSAGFHTYAIDWRPGVLVWYIDGVERKRITGSQVPSEPMYMLANLAVGGSWPVPPDSTTPFPAYFDIDYIKAYQYDSVPAGNLRPHYFGHMTADKYIVSAGDTIVFDINVEVNQAQDGLRIQSYVSDKWESWNFGNTAYDTAATLSPGIINLKRSITVPVGTPPGVYHMSVGLFHQDWTYVDWLAQAVVIEVK